jgi:hypothetical protein
VTRKGLTGTRGADGDYEDVIVELAGDERGQWIQVRKRGVH